MRVLARSTAAIVMFVALTADACPPILKKLKTDYLPAEIPNLCAAVQRYNKALKALEERGVAMPTRISDLYSPRMINPTEWEKKKDSVDYNPYIFYNPAPKTFDGWQRGAKLVAERVMKNRVTGRPEPLTLDWLRQVHASALDGLIGTSGNFRHHGEVGLAISTQGALTLEQADAVRASEYKSIKDASKGIMQFTTTECFEHKPVEFQRKFNEEFARTRMFNWAYWPAIDPKKTYSAEDGTQKQCGYITYADLDEVPQQMDLFLKEINGTMTSWGSEKPQGDPILTAARAQRWFISIHPFEDGNGRMSRFLMDTVLMSLGLPASIINDQNNDVYYTEKQWAEELGRGILRAIQIAEGCVPNPHARGCEPVSLFPPPVKPAVNQ